MMRASKWKQLGLVLLVTALDLICGPYLLLYLKNSGRPVYSAATASADPAGFLGQCLLLGLYTMFLVAIMGISLRKKFWSAMGLEIRKPVQWICVGTGTAILAVMSAVGVVRTGDSSLIFLNLLFYLVFVGFAEEFLVRGLCVYFLRDFSWQVRYLLPSALFALSHLFAYNNFMPLTWSYVLDFLRMSFGGLMAAGCCFQFLKERTGTLWVPILVHAILDFSVVLRY